MAINARDAYCSSSFLIIEDKARTRESLRLSLESGAHRVQAAPFGPNALQLVRSFDPDVVLIGLGADMEAKRGLASQIRDLPLGDMYTLVAMMDGDIQEAGPDFDLVIPTTASCFELMESLRRLDQAWTVGLPVAGQAQAA